ncbi:MAG: transporter, family, hexuronate transporter, partial [Sediminibacterium sp.]|nr:transporter, family, hexuronate transporter [Sediminibacterium sp.]
MKVKGLRWWVLGLIVLITIINYLDRGTLNYMWVANVRTNYTLIKDTAGQTSLPYAVYVSATKQYALFNTDRTIQNVDEKMITVVSSSSVQYIKKGGIAYGLGLVDPNDSQKVTDDKLKKLYSYIYMFFMVAYGISQLFSGRIYDKIGTRKGFVMSAIIWGTADMLTSLARGVASLSIFRVLLGLGEAGPWPGTVKSNAEWFPVKERAFAQGMFGAGGSIGNILAPLVISMLFLAYGWQNTFLIVGSLGIIWIVPWLILNKKKPAEHPWITEEEKAYILSGQLQSSATGDKGLSWKELLQDRKS